MSESAPQRAVARRVDGYTHELRIRDHTLTADEPADAGGNDRGPTPQELLSAALASCTAVTIEMYADRKGWDLGEVEVTAEFTPGPHGNADSFEVTMRIPGPLTEEQTQRIMVIAGKCPVHRALARESPIEIVDRIEPV
jgi:putative redox protein